MQFEQPPEQLCMHFPFDKKESELHSIHLTSPEKYSHSLQLFDEEPELQYLHIVLFSEGNKKKPE